MPDKDGYPTDEELKTIEEWPCNKGFVSLMEYVESCWWRADWGFSQTKRGRYYLSTGGWSGNESIISALEANYMFWITCWAQSRRGGHYIFEIKKPKKNNSGGQKRKGTETDNF